MKHMLLFLLTMIPLTYGQDLQGRSSTVSYSSSSTSGLTAVVKIASEKKLPLGILVRTGSQLCMDRQRIEVSAANPQQMIEKVAVDLDYVLMDAGGVLLLRPKELSHGERKLLDLDIGDFAPPAASVHVLGGFLEAVILGTLHPSQGLAGDIVSRVDAEVFQVQVGPHATPAKVANKIISGKMPGVWIMTLSTDSSSDTLDEEKFKMISVYSYDEDALALSQVNCSDGSMGK